MINFTYLHPQLHYEIFSDLEYDSITKIAKSTTTLKSLQSATFQQLAEYTQYGKALVTCPTLSTTNCENYTDTSHKL